MFFSGFKWTAALLKWAVVRFFSDYTIKRKGLQYNENSSNFSKKEKIS